MAIRQVITFRLKPGTGQLFREGFAPIAAAVSAADGCEHYELFASQTDPDCYVMLERWRDLAALEAALASYKPSDPPAFLQALAGKPVRERYHVE